MILCFLIYFQFLIFNYLYIAKYKWERRKNNLLVSLKKERDGNTAPLQARATGREKGELRKVRRFKS